jgi:uncharacterized Fe-S cluster-containing radical SAM superfamily protein
MWSSLKASCYTNLARRNAWLLGFDAKVRNYLRYRLTARREVIDVRRAGPVFMTISLTRRCNLSCRFCIVGDVLNKRGWDPYESTVVTTARLLDHPVARRCLYIMLTGGEPLLNREILPIVRLIKARPHLLSVNTNGLLLGDMVEDLRAAGLDMLNVSVYDENLDALAGILPFAARRIYTKLLKIIGREDVEHPERIEAVLRLARGAGCPRVFLQNVYPHVDALADHRVLPAVIEPSGDETPPIAADDGGAYARVRRDLGRRYPDVLVSWPAPVPRGVPPGGKRCRMPWYLLVVDTEGNLGFCSAHASCTGPNLYDLPVGDVMNTEPWISTRRALLARDHEVPAACAGCYTLDDSWRREM